MSRGNLKSGDVNTDDTAAWPFPEEAAAQLNAALAVVERAERMHNRLLDEVRLAAKGKHSNVWYGKAHAVLDALEAVMEPDDATRATLPGANWLGGGE